MAEDNNLKLLEVVLAEVRSVRTELGQVRDDQVRLHDFKTFADNLETRFRLVEEDQAKQALDINSHSNFIDSTRWAFRIFGVAVLGAFLTGASSLFHVTLNSGTAAFNLPTITHQQQMPSSSHSVINIDANSAGTH